MKRYAQLFAALAFLAFLVVPTACQFVAGIDTLETGPPAGACADNCFEAIQAPAPGARMLDASPPLFCSAPYRGLVAEACGPSGKCKGATQCADWCMGKRIDLRHAGDCVTCLNKMLNVSQRDTCSNDAGSSVANVAASTGSFSTGAGMPDCSCKKMLNDGRQGCPPNSDYIGLVACAGAHCQAQCPGLPEGSPASTLCENCLQNGPGAASCKQLFDNCKAN